MTRRTLPDDTVRAVVRTQRTLLGPLDYISAEEWLRSCARSIRELVGASHSLLMLHRDGAMRAWSDDTDLSALRSIEGLLTGYDGAGNPLFQDAVGTEAVKARRRAGSGAYHESMLFEHRSLERQPVYMEAFQPQGFRYLTGLSVPLEQGEAAVMLGFRDPDRPGFGAPGMDRLRLVVPAFEAGIRMHLRLREGDRRLNSLLDGLRAPAIFFDTMGEVLTRSRAWEAMVREDPSGERLDRGAGTLARRVHAAANGGGSGASAGDPSGATTLDVRTERGRYRLHAVLLEPDLFQDAAVAVGLRRPPPSDGDLRVRFRLTPRQIEVARLLARGATNAAIARRLGISPHTAHRHTQAVLRKMDLHSRSAVASHLWGPEGP